MTKANVREDSPRESLLRAQAHIWNHIFSFINSMSLKCALQLGIPDIIRNHGGPMALTDLVKALPAVHPKKRQGIPRLMRLLVHSGFFDQRNHQPDGEDGEEVRYALNDVSALLLKDNPLSVRPFALAMLDPILTDPWQFLGSWFQNGDVTPCHTAHGSPFWEYTGLVPELNGLFNDAMASDARLIASALLGSECKRVFEGLRSLVDIGGGTGTMAKAIATEFPDLTCTVFDLPHVVTGLNNATNKNLKYVGGDMFKEIPPADAYLLKWMIHDWSDDESVKILKRCKDGLTWEGKGGKVIIIDIVTDYRKTLDVESVETQLFFDMLMMVLTTGKERSESEWAKLFAEAGFRDYKITPMLGLRSVIEVYP